MRAILSSVLVSLVCGLAGPALGQASSSPDTPPRANPRMSHCIAIADAAPGIEYLDKASFRDPVPEYSVRISYVAHSAYLIQTRGGLSAVTDYPGYLGNVDFIPDVVTMNHAHSSHYTTAPDPAIPHVLRGWSETFGEAAEHHLDLGEMLIRNVSTDIRSMGGVEENGNSIFIFEVEGLCVGHLGHLHHEPNDDQYAAIGRLDVVMVPVDGGMTLDTASMVRVVQRLKSSIVLPMHWFSGASLGWFLDGVEEEFDIDLREESSLTVSLRDLPERPTIIVLQPEYLRDEMD
ncbi:MAG: MBL fold metallo-hydrolase [Pseudooceanicola atlanticus]